MAVVSITDVLSHYSEDSFRKTACDQKIVDTYLSHIKIWQELYQERNAYNSLKVQTPKEGNTIEKSQYALKCFPVSDVEK